MPKLKGQSKKPVQVSLTDEQRLFLRAFTGLAGNSDGEKARTAIGLFLLDKYEKAPHLFDPKVLAGRRRKN